MSSSYKVVGVYINTINTILFYLSFDFLQPFYKLQVYLSYQREAVI